MYSRNQGENEMTHQLKITKNGKTDTKYIPNTFAQKLIDQQINSYKNAGYTVEFIDGGKHIHICPDCGREMESRDGGEPYCENCEG
jgi:predicted RNA-binding Zn-ribbon protein involved in translation (DUF1610 family)